MLGIHNLLLQYPHSEELSLEEEKEMWITIAEHFDKTTTLWNKDKRELVL